MTDSKDKEWRSKTACGCIVNTRISKETDGSFRIKVRAVEYCNLPDCCRAEQIKESFGQVRDKLEAKGVRVIDNKVFKEMN